MYIGAKETTFFFGIWQYMCGRRRRQDFYCNTRDKENAIVCQVLQAETLVDHRDDCSKTAREAQLPLKCEKISDQISIVVVHFID